SVPPDRRSIGGVGRIRELSMAKQQYTASEAAAALGISLDTLRRWDRAGRIRVERDASNRRIVRASEIDRLRGDGEGAHISARNRFHAIVTEVKVEGLMAQVEMVVSDAVRIVLIDTRAAAEEFGME